MYDPLGRFAVAHFVSLYMCGWEIEGALSAFLVPVYMHIQNMCVNKIFSPKMVEQQQQQRKEKKANRFETTHAHRVYMRLAFWMQLASICAKKANQICMQSASERARKLDGERSSKNEQTNEKIAKTYIVVVN